MLSTSCGLMLLTTTAGGQELPPAPTPMSAEQFAARETPVVAEADPTAVPPATGTATDPAQIPVAAPPPVAPKSAPPKKPAPPVFPGPKVLPPTGPYKPLFFDNDFSILKDPKHEYLLGEEFKNMPFELCEQPLTISSGGEIRHRYMNTDNILRPGPPMQQSYNLWRWRHYVDAKYGDDFRVYFEGIEADSFGTKGADLAIDVNRWDVQNLFADWTFLRTNTDDVHTLRYGRQEMLFGRQRLVSPLDWANTRRNFEGLRYMVKGQDYKFDLFAVRPVNSATGFNSVATYDSRFDQPNYHVWFSGAYFTYTGIPNTVIDNYWLYLDTTNLQIPTKPDGHRHLFGSRVSHLMPSADESRVWDFDAEGGLQVGRDNGAKVLAGFATAIAGHTWKKAPWTPRVSGTFYYGSGDQTAKNGTNNTFNTLFPLGHAYWALSDNVSGQNLYDYALQGEVKPTKKTALVSAYHWLALASNGDTLYNVAGNPVGTPGHGRDVGQALDLYGYYAFNPNFDVQAGYSWFWYGSYIDAVAPRSDATQFYVQTSLRY